MQVIDADADFELLMRHWHVTTDYATALRAEYEALRQDLPGSHPRLEDARRRWRSAEAERRQLLRAIERVEEATLQ
jgi:hypothetical protein